MRVLQALFAIQGWFLAPVEANSKGAQKSQTIGRKFSSKEVLMKLTIPRWIFPGPARCFLAGTDEDSFVIIRSYLRHSSHGLLDFQNQRDRRRLLKPRLLMVCGSFLCLNSFTD